MAITTFKATVSMTDKPDKYISQSRNFKVIFESQKKNNDYNTGITPNEGILCSLGACEDIAAGTFYKKEKFDYSSLYIPLKGYINNDRHGYDHIDLDIHFRTSKNKGEINNFVKFMEKHCPVRDNLVNKVPIVTKEINVK